MYVLFVETFYKMTKMCLTTELKLFLQTVLFIYKDLIVRNNSLLNMSLKWTRNDFQIEM